MEQLAHFENAQSITLIAETKQEEFATSFEHHLAKNDVALTLFNPASASGVSLAKSGKSCPHLIMSFGTLHNAAAFLDKHKGHLRFSKSLV